MEDVSKQWFDSMTTDDLLQVDLEKELPPSITKRPHVKLSILKSHNYDIWAQEFEMFLTSRGLFRIVTGESTMPRDHIEKAKRWSVLDQWIAVLLVNKVEDTQKSHVTASGLRTSNAIWIELKRVHGVSGKGRLLAMLTKFNGYTKGAAQSIDQMASDLRELREEIRDLSPIDTPSDQSMATVIMTACEGKEFDTAKYVLSMSDDLTTEMTVRLLRSAESEVYSKDGGFMALNGRAEVSEEESEEESSGNETGHRKRNPLEQISNTLRAKQARKPGGEVGYGPSLI